MLEVADALSKVLDRAAARPAVTRPIGESLDLILAEDVTSDVDSPPHDKSIVDGYAIISNDLQSGTAVLTVLEEVTAGRVPTHAVAPGSAIRVMTGAPVPAGADAVVMVEQSELAADGQRVALRAERVPSGQNIMPRASSMVRGTRVLTAGTLLRPIEIGVLAEVGRSHVQVVPRPSVAVLATGNELVPADCLPGPGHIRNSNGPMLVAAAQRAGAMATDLGIARDEPGHLRALIGAGLASDILVISGGVSAGVLDLVPGVLAALGVEQVFHKVRLKPGKPLWFGVLAHKRGPRLVFGLPGNPVSSLVCFELFVRPAIARLAGRSSALAELTAALTVGFSHRGERPTYYPARLLEDGGPPSIEPLKWRGSGDLATLVAANALACFLPGTREYVAGEVIRVLRLS